LAAQKRWRKVTREEYYRELSSLGVMGAKRKRLRSEYFSILGRISGIAREQRKLTQQVPYASTFTLIVIAERIRELDRQREELLERARHIRNVELPELQRKFEKELEIFRQKIVPPPPPPPPKLHRIKVRLYNMEHEPTPAGMFQGFFIIDGVINPDTGLVDWNWWLTRQEIAIAKYHFVGYFKGAAKWCPPDQVKLAYFDEPEGIPYEESPARYKRNKAGYPYAKNVPNSYIAKAERLSVGELIVGESSQMPEPNTEPTSENMGVFFERAMIIKDDQIVWDEFRNRFIYHPPESVVKQVKKELKIK